MADKPVTREEKYLAYLTGDYTGEIPKPITRKEKYLYELCLKGIGGEISPEEIKAAVNEYLEKNPVKPGATTEQAQQIEQNKTDIASLKTETGSLKEDLTSKADKTSLAQTDRKLDALWKLNQGISYEFQTDEAKSYQKTVPSGAKMVSIKSIGGKTIVWNQLIDETYGGSVTRGNVTIVNNKDGSYTVFTNGAATETVTAGVYFLKANRDSGKYYLKGSPSNGKEIGYSLSGTYIWKPEYGKADYGNGVIIDDNVFLNNSDIVTIRVNEGTVISTPIVFKPQLFNLTKMFGAGNEPSTVEEFEAMFPADYYPYNAGELMSAPVNEVTEQGKNLLGGKAFADKIVELGGTLDEANGKVSIAASVISDKTVFEFPDESKSYTIILSGENTNTNLQSTNLKTDKGSYNRFVDRCSITTVTGVKKIFGAYDTQIVIYDYEKCGIFEGVLTADDFKPYHKTSYPIPQAVLNLPGYGWSTGNVRNEVDFENKKYIQRVGKYVITDSETFVTTYAPVITFLNKRHLIKRSVKAINNQGLSIFSANEKGDIWQFLISDIGLDEDATVDDIKEWFKVHPVTSYYPMLNEEITDISDIIGNTFQEPLEVEAGGTLTFRNSHGDDYRIPVPNSEEYVISLAEVAK